MKKTIIIGIVILVSNVVLGQTPKEIIARVYAAQHMLKTASYSLKRTDTLVTGDTRIMTGSVKIKTDVADALYGFQFWCKLDDVNVETIYNGHLIYEANNNTKTYTINTNPVDLSHVFYSTAGGHVILTDLVKLDTSKAIGFMLSQNTQQYYLTIKYADYKQEDVSKRYKIVTIDKKTMLPIAVRSHQEPLGRVQDLYYQITNIQVNEPQFNYDFTSPTFLTEYNQQIITNNVAQNPAYGLKGIAAPYFELISFNNKKVSTNDFKGKVVLLDFWEVWCGPCMEAMPKVENLYEKYKGKGLLIYGITSDAKQLAPSKLLIQKRNIALPMLVGSEQLKKDYKVNGFPLYILINKSGKISFVSEGYSEDVEAAIKSAIND
ncbi:MAG: TlpA disulfide reductase family protein [Mucilaginibacter sp.]